MSSITNGPGNTVYTDLVMTRYPKQFDERSGPKDNPNMHRWTNLTDYNMAEHVNALQDAVMAMQRTLGEYPQLNTVVKDANGVVINDANTIAGIAAATNVKIRLDKLEAFSWAPYDKRFGGATWDAASGSTIQGHKHNGEGSNPNKISLTAEVTGSLPVQNLDLTNGAKGLTGEAILLSKTSSTKISESLADKLSLTTGGSIAKDAVVVSKGKTQTRWNLEFDYTDRVTGVGTRTDVVSTFGTAAYFSGTTKLTFLQKEIENLYFGKYVLIVRASSSSLASEDVFEIAYENIDGTTIKKNVYKGSDFGVQNQYRQFYLPFDYDTQGGKKQIRITKLASPTSAQITFDYALVTPIHPAIFDR
jgi:hypothetical protein